MLELDGLRQGLVRQHKREVKLGERVNLSRKKSTLLPRRWQFVSSQSDNLVVHSFAVDRNTGFRGKTRYHSRYDFHRVGLRQRYEFELNPPPFPGP